MHGFRVKASLAFLLYREQPCANLCVEEKCTTEPLAKPTKSCGMQLSDQLKKKKKKEKAPSGSIKHLLGSSSTAVYIYFVLPWNFPHSDRVAHCSWLKFDQLF